MTEWDLLVSNISRLDDIEDAGYKSSLFEGANTAWATFDNSEADFDNVFKETQAIDIELDDNEQSTCFIESIEIDKTTGIMRIAGRDKMGRIQSVFPKEATVSAITDKKRSDIIKWLMITQGYGNGTTVVNVQDSPTDAGVITETFRGLRSLYDIIFRYAIDDNNYQFTIDKFNDAGSVNGSPSTPVAGVTRIPFDGTTSIYSDDVFIGGKVIFTSGAESGNSFLVVDNTSTYFDVFGDATGAIDDDTFDLKSNDLYYEPRNLKTYTARSLRVEEDDIEDYTMPDKTVDVVNKVTIRGKQNLFFTVDSTTTTTITVDNALEADVWITGSLSFVDGATEYIWTITDNDTDTFTVEGPTAPSAVLSAGDNIRAIISYIKEDQISQEFYADEDGNPLINERDIYDPSLDTQAKAIQYGNNFLNQHSFVLQNFEFIDEGFSDLRVGDLILVKVPEDGSRINDEYLLVTEIEWTYSTDQTRIKVTYFERDIQHKISEIIESIRKRDLELIFTSNVILRSLTYSAKVAMKARAEIVYRTISGESFVISRNIVGANVVGSFNGTNAYAEPNNLGNNFGNGITVSMYVKPRAFPGAGIVSLGAHLSGPTDDLFRCELDTAGKVGFTFSQSGVSSTLLSTQTLFLNVWTHVILYYDKTERRIYFNLLPAVTAESKTGNIDWSALQRFVLGAQWWNGIGYLSYANCFITEIKVYNKALDSSERSTLYNGGEPDKTSLQIHIDPNKRDLTYFYDRTLNRNHAALTNVLAAGDNLQGLPGGGIGKDQAKIGDQSGSSNWQGPITW